jgi:DNA gyrase inhibitor GyrI
MSMHTQHPMANSWPFFFKNWLAKQKGKVVNSACYAFGTTQKKNENSQKACATTNTCTAKVSTNAIFSKYNSQTSQDQFQQS